MSLEIYSKLREKWKKNYTKLIKFSSQKASQRKRKCKRTHFNKNGTKDANMRKSSGDRNPECNELRKGRETLDSFTSLPWNTKLIIESQNL